MSYYVYIYRYQWKLLPQPRENCVCFFVLFISIFLQTKVQKFMNKCEPQLAMFQFSLRFPQFISSQFSFFFWVKLRKGKLVLLGRSCYVNQFKLKRNSLFDFLRNAFAKSNFIAFLSHCVLALFACICGSNEARKSFQMTSCNVSSWTTWQSCNVYIIITLLSFFFLLANNL